MSHTPTPWTYEAETKTIRSVPANYWLASMDSWDGAVNHQANAAHIIHCVNVHNQLVEALEYCVEQLEMISDYEITRSDIDAIDAARKALAAAEKGA